MFENIAYAAAPAATDASQQAPNPIAMFFPFVIMFGLMWLLILRPQQKQRQQLQKMVENLKKGDEVVTTGGLLGTVTSIQNDYVVIRVGDNAGAKLEVLKSAISGLRKQGSERG